MLLFGIITQHRNISINQYSLILFPMSSISSSNCESSDCNYLLDDIHNIYSNSRNGNSIQDRRQMPIFTTMAHPLVYYAEVQRPRKRQSNCQSSKRNQNCFVKAFKWYTQERVPNTNIEIAERCGFANWLDSKYVEYLRESRHHQCYEVRAQDTATIEPCGPCNSTTNQPCTTKRFARIKSPWRKRKRRCNDSRVLPDKCTNPSCEFIMQPKDLTRAASDNCYHAPTPGCCIKSNATVVSSNMPGNMRCSGRSQSLNSVYRERSAPQYIDTISHTVQEGPRNQVPSKSCCVCHKDQIQQVPSKPKLKAPDVSCQCPEEEVVLVNVQTQYEPRSQLEPTSCFENLGPCYCIMPVQEQKTKTSTSEIDSTPTLTPSKQSYAKLKKQKKKQKKVKHSNVSCQCPEESIVKVDTQSQHQSDQCECPIVCTPSPSRDTKEVSTVFGPKPIRRQSNSAVACCINEETRECVVKEVAIVSKLTHTLTCVVNDAVQTSDHAICIDKGGLCPCSLFFKIVCADKLNKECF